MTDYLLMAFTDPVLGQDEAFNRWYDEQHLTDALAIPGFKTARRYRACPGRDEPPRGYLAVYEITTDDIEATLADMSARRRTEKMPVSEAFPPDPVVHLFQAIGPWNERKPNRPPAQQDPESGLT